MCRWPAGVAVGTLILTSEASASAPPSPIAKRKSIQRRQREEHPPTPKQPPLLLAMSRILRPNHRATKYLAGTYDGRDLEADDVNSKLKHIQNWAELAQAVSWSAAGLAKKCGASGRTLERYFLRNFDKTPRSWLTEQRQQMAAELLRHGYGVKEVAGRIGYRHASTFSRQFMKHWGCYPKQLPPSLNVTKGQNVA
jgi:AraC-like DNA-binding protein